MHPPPINYSERQALFNRCKSYLVGHDYPTGWFLDPDFKREDAVHWMLWALFSSETAQPEWEEEIVEYVEEIEKILGRKLDHGTAEAGLASKSMRLTFDPVVMLHRPFVWYLVRITSRSPSSHGSLRSYQIVGGVDMCSSLSILAHGFKHYATPKWFQAFPPRPLTIFSQQSAHPDLSYWYRPHRSTTKLPILFLHGIGVRLSPLYMSSCTL